jgi:hypothetical protein
MRDWNGTQLNVDYVARLVREALAKVIPPTKLTSAPVYTLTGDTLVLAVNHGNYPEVYVCKVLRYGCPSDDGILFIEN